MTLALCPWFESGILALQLRRDRRQVLERCLRRDAVAQPANAVEIVAASPLFAAVLVEQRRPEFRISPGRKGEVAAAGLRRSCRRLRSGFTDCPMTSLRPPKRFSHVP